MSVNSEGPLTPEAPTPAVANEANIWKQCAEAWFSHVTNTVQSTRGTWKAAEWFGLQKNHGVSRESHGGFECVITL